MIKNFEVIDETRENTTSICININDSMYTDLIFNHVPEEFSDMYDDYLDINNYEEFSSKYDKDKLDEFYSYFFGLDCIVEDENAKGILKKVLGNVKLPGEVTHIYIDYPLSCTVKVNVFGEKTYFDLISDIKEAYKYIYDFEENSLKDTKVKNIEGTFNRCQTDGKFGIWGHDIGDLVIESIDILDNGGVNLFIES